MSTSIADKVAALGHKLPEASNPAANYLSRIRSGNLLFISGQVSTPPPAAAHPVRVGVELDIDQGRQAACSAGLGLLAQISAATDGQTRAVRRILRLGVFVAAPPDVTRHSEVANGVSDLIVGVFGDAGRHVRTAVGVASLPRGTTVEVDAIVELEQ
jgi:enamine deaminase RidA (YjgF/YER057c/UK114 family)